MNKLISHLKAKSIITDSRVEAAMLKVDRSLYCPSQNPYTDAPYTIGYGATISAPHMHAYALEIIKDKLVDGANVLDVGSGSGYLTSCMAHMCGPKGTVYGVEHIEELVKQAEENIRRDCEELLNTGRVKFFVADGRAGLPNFGPFDVIHVGATAPELPKVLLEQLREGGCMVVPVQRGLEQMFESIEKHPGGRIEHQQHLGVRYVPLTDRDSQLGIVK